VSALPPPPPPPEARNGHDPAFAPDPTVEARDVSVWFGQKVALSELSCSFGAGVTGLLGPNGAGKTTLMRAMTGLLPVNQGQVLVAGRSPRQDRSVYATLALVPEDEAVPQGLTPR
jgi:ABC-2 type transport system ATP-binding protein